MSTIIQITIKLTQIINAFIPPVIFYIAIPFIALMSLFKIVREIR